MGIYCRRPECIGRICAESASADVPAATAGATLLSTGRDNPDGAPLEYHVRLLGAYRNTMEKHGLKPPPGYGTPGAGNAVFSVSSFMDVLAPEEAAVPA